MDDTAKLTDIVIARLGDRWDLVRKSEVFIKYEAEVSSRVSDCEELLILASCLLRPMSRNSVLEELSVRRFAVIQEEIRFSAL